MSKPINFAKMAADLDTNPKIRRAGRNGREVYLFVLRRVAALHAHDGRIPVSNVDPWYLHDQLQMSEAEAQEGLAACLRPWNGEEPGLLEIAGGDVVVTGWGPDWGRIPVSDRDRKRLQRERERQRALPAGDADDHDESDPRHEVSGQDVTRRDCHGSDQIRPDLNPEHSPPRAPPEIFVVEGSGSCGDGESHSRDLGSEGPVRSTTGTHQDHSGPTPLPVDWAPVPTSALAGALQYVRTVGGDPDHEIAKFCAEARAHGWTRVDWTSALVKWLLGTVARRFGPRRADPRFGRVEPPPREAFTTGVIDLNDTAEERGPPQYREHTPEERDALIAMAHAITANPEAAVMALPHTGTNPRARTG